MVVVCSALVSCESCKAVPECIWGIIYQAGGQCVNDLLDIDRDVIGSVQFGQSCSDPFCKDVLVRKKVDWSAVGGLSTIFGIVIGAVIIIIFVWCQRRWNREAEPAIVPPNELEPAVQEFARRQAVLNALEEFFEMEANAQDLELRREILRRFGANQEGGANELLEAIRQLNNQLEEIVVQGGPNILLQNLDADEEDHLQAAAVLQVDPGEEVNEGAEVLIELGEAAAGPPQEGEIFQADGTLRLRVPPERAAKTLAKENISKHAH